MTPESDILDRLIQRIAKLVLSAQSDLGLLEATPANLEAFEAMSVQRQSAARAFLKSFEQIEDQLSRSFRVIPKLVGQDDSRWFARDHADFLEGFGVFDDAADWSKVVKLRNQLVHDYPLDPQIQFDRLKQAIACLPLLVETYARFTEFVRVELPGKTL